MKCCGISLDYLTPGANVSRWVNLRKYRSIVYWHVFFQNKADFFTQVFDGVVCVPLTTMPINICKRNMLNVVHDISMKMN